MKKLTQYVINKTLKKNKFNPQLIYKSLLKETSISEEDANKVTETVVRTIIGICSIVKIITAPMIREIACSVLLQFGLEIERLQYTRIGFPFNDIDLLLANKAYYENIDKRIANHVKTEHSNVFNMIEKLRINNNNGKYDT